MYLQNLLGHGLKKGCHKKKEWDYKIIWHKTRARLQIYTILPSSFFWVVFCHYLSPVLTPLQNPSLQTAHDSSNRRANLAISITASRGAPSMAVVARPAPPV